MCTIFNRAGFTVSPYQYRWVPYKTAPGAPGPMKILQEVSIRIRKFLAKFWSKA